MDYFLFVALSVFASREKTGLPEIVLSISKHEEILRLLNLLAGQKVVFPTHRELSVLLNCALAIYHIQEEGRSWKWLQDRYFWSDQWLGDVQERYATWQQYVVDNGIDQHKIFTGMYSDVQKLR